MKAMNKIRPETKEHPLAVAAREVNDYSEKHGIDATITDLLGLEIKDLTYMAEQRGLRVLYAMRGIGFNTSKPFEMLLSPSDIKLLITAIMPAYMDGLAIGWRAAKQDKNQ